MGVFPEQDADENTRNGKDQKQQRCPGALSASENGRQNTVRRLRRHKRFKHPFNQNSAKEVSDGNGEKLQGVPRRQKCS